ncbi:hypothetical protein BKA70DRAFT_1490814 [Coprinopsis sp. MPI-PUGE-AT-0042]|nr:hypothetical protein BKA70DRAFT_1490814 [Coprinopsis sp. MPI-PUGE-AT-0042]
MAKNLALFLYVSTSTSMSQASDTSPFSPGATVNGGFFFTGGTHQNINTPQNHPVVQNNYMGASGNGATTTTPVTNQNGATTSATSPQVVGLNKANALGAEAQLVIREKLKG